MWEMMAYEYWRPVPTRQPNHDIEDYYLASNKGRLRSLDHVGPKGNRVRGKVLSQHDNRKNDGQSEAPPFYQQVSIRCADGELRNKQAHQLVLSAFIEWPGPGFTVDHINDLKNDNGLSNLRWADGSQQNQARPIHPKNKTGFKGVERRWSKKYGWRYRGIVERQVDGQRVLLRTSTFDNPEDAAIALAVLRRRLHDPEFLRDE
jgi:hypothetical protein